MIICVLSMQLQDACSGFPELPVMDDEVKSNEVLKSSLIASQPSGISFSTLLENIKPHALLRTGNGPCDMKYGNRPQHEYRLVAKNDMMGSC